MKNLKEVEEILVKAIKKVGVKKENDLCKYIPMASGGYMHHFTLKKMKRRNPSELASILQKYIIIPDSPPPTIAPKKRAPRGSRKKKDHITFTRTQLERMLKIARLAGDSEIISILSPKKSLSSCKKELIQSIKDNQIKMELWNQYIETINSQIQGPLEQNFLTNK